MVIYGLKVEGKLIFCLMLGCSYFVKRLTMTRESILRELKKYTYVDACIASCLRVFLMDDQSSKALNLRLGFITVKW